MRIIHGRFTVLHLLRFASCLLAFGWYLLLASSSSTFTHVGQYLSPFLLLNFLLYISPLLLNFACTSSHQLADTDWFRRRWPGLQRQPALWTAAAAVASTTDELRSGQSPTSGQRYSSGQVSHCSILPILIFFCQFFRCVSWLICGMLLLWLVWLLIKLYFDWLWFT